MKTPPFYEVLRPMFFKTGQKGLNRETGEPFDWYGCRWEFVGLAHSMEDAKAKYGGAPVLQPVAIASRAPQHRNSFVPPGAAITVSRWPSLH